MSRYFMGGTRLESFEKMMMDPSRSASSLEDPQQGRPEKKTPDKSSVPKRRENSV